MLDSHQDNAQPYTYKYPMDLQMYYQDGIAFGIEEPAAGNFSNTLLGTTHNPGPPNLNQLGGNVTEKFVPPPELTFNADSLISVITYCVLFFIAATGNLTVFIILLRNRRRRSRVNLFIMHLSVADMIVTFLMMPMEIGWHVTVSWNAGDMGCRLFMFCRVWGFYLSSFILITISLDRYFAIAHPLSLINAEKRGRFMLLLAWIFSIIASAPQIVIFHVEQHPSFPWFAQCVTFNFFPSPSHELAYNLFNLTAMYLAPLIIIIIAYSLILVEITKKSRESHNEMKERCPLRRSVFRRSGIGRIEKARARTLKMTIVIVLVFVACWTPYFVMSAWWWFDPASAMKVDPKIQRALFIFAVSNSCVNPMVYGSYSRILYRLLVGKCARWRKRFADGLSSSQSTPVKCLNQHALLPYIASAHSSGDNRNTNGSANGCNRNTQNGGPSSGVRSDEACADTQQRLETEPVVTLENGTTVPLSAAFTFKRTNTPPHIANGRGIRGSFDKYMFL